MRRFVALFITMGLLFSGCSFGGGAKKNEPFGYMPYTIKEVGFSAMKESDRASAEPYAYEVTLYDGDNKILQAEQSVRVILPYAMFDVDYGTNAEEKYNTLSVYLDEGGNRTLLCGRYVRDLEGVEVFVNKSGTYVVKDNPVKLEIKEDYAAPAAALIARGVMTEEELNLNEELTWDTLDACIAKIFNSQPGIISRCGFDNGTKFNAGKRVSLQDTAAVVYNAMSTIREFKEPKNQTRKKVSRYAKSAVSAFEEIKSMPSGDVKNPADMKKLAMLLGKAYFMYGKVYETDAEITQPESKSSLNGIEAFAPTKALEGSTEYSIKVNSTQVSCEKSIDLNVSRFGVSGKFDVEITAKHNITGLAISPMTLGIVPKIYKNTVKFTVDGPQKLFLRMGGDEYLALFAEDMTSSFAKADSTAKTINVADYNLDNTGKTDVTEEFQKILDKASAEKATVYIPDGVYLIHRVFVKSDTDIFFEPSAFLKHETDFEGAKSRDETHKIGLLQLDNAKNVKLYGYGGILGFGTEKRNIDNNYGPRNILLRWCDNVKILGLCSFDSGSWNTQLYESSNLLVDDYKILNNMINQWTDSIDIDSSNNTVIQNCFLLGEDDNLDCKASADYSENVPAAFKVTIRNNICLSGAAALKAGHETLSDELYDLTYENNYIIRADTSIHVADFNLSKIRNLKFINNYIEFTNSSTNKLRRDIYIRVDSFDDKGGELGPKAGIDGILIDGLFVHTKAYQKNQITGYDKARDIKNVTIQNYFIAGQKVTPETFRVEIDEFAQFSVK